MPISNLNRASAAQIEILLKLLSGGWRDSPTELQISSEELSNLLSLILDSGAAPLTWWRLRNRDDKDERVAQELLNSYRYATIQGDLLQHEIKELFSFVRLAGVEPVLVKGWAVARFYPEPGLRPCGDIDICVHPAQYKKAVDALRDWTDHSFLVDLHEGFAGLDQANADDLYLRSELIGLGDVEVRVLSDEDHLRVLCLHFLRHGAFRPLWLCDIGAAVESRPQKFDWERCLGSDRRQRDWIACTIGLAHQLLGARLADTPVEQRSKRLPTWLVPTVLKQWETPNTLNHGVLRHRAGMAEYFRNPAGVMRDLRNRWPNPIEATIYVGGSFNELPRLPFQVAECLGRTAKFVRGLPRMIHNSRKQQPKEDEQLHDAR